MYSEPIESNIVNGVGLSKGTKMYYARIMGDVGICYVQTLIIRTIYEGSFVGIDDMTKTAQIIGNNMINKVVFNNKKQADELVKQAQKSGKIRIFKEMDNE